MKKIKQFEIEQLPIEELKPYRLNAKLHPQEQIKKIIRSIELTGFDQPIVVNKKDHSIIKGHGRLEAAIQMGMITVPVIVLDVSQDVADKARLLDNKSAEGDYDIEKLLKELTRFQDDIYDTGYGRDELDQLLAQLESQIEGFDAFESFESKNSKENESVNKTPNDDPDIDINFSPVSVDAQPRLDQLKPITCPYCKQSFTKDEC